MRRGYDRVKGSIGKSYDEIEGVTVSVSRNFDMLSEITTGKEVKKLDCLSIAEVVNMDIEVASNDEFMRGDGCVGYETMRIYIEYIFVDLDLIFQGNKMKC